MSHGCPPAPTAEGLAPGCLSEHDDGMASFETVADEYDVGRPSYPDGLFQALGPLAGRRVLDVGAGTGIATRALLARHADVVAVDPGRELLRRAMTHTGGLRTVVADGAALPVRSSAVDLVCFAQSWHWLDPATRVDETHRVLRTRGRWAGWWSHARADGEQWFDDHWAAIERSCPGTHRRQRNTDWGATIETAGMFDVHERVTVPWIRKVPVDVWMTDQASHSYVVGLPHDARTRLLSELQQVAHSQFTDGTMVVPYETWLWIATRR